MGTTGPAIEAGSVVGVRYIVYRLSSGAYFKYSSGGKPVFLWSLGYGNEGEDDVGDLCVRCPPPPPPPLSRRALASTRTAPRRRRPRRTR